MGIGLSEELTKYDSVGIRGYLQYDVDHGHYRPFKTPKGTKLYTYERSMGFSYDKGIFFKISFYYLFDFYDITTPYEALKNKKFDLEYSYLLLYIRQPNDDLSKNITQSDILYNRELNKVKILKIHDFDADKVKAELINQIPRIISKKYSYYI